MQASRKSFLLLFLEKEGLSPSTWLNQILPPTCATCPAEVSAPGLLCSPCFTSLNFIAGPICQSCGVPLATDTCQACEAERPPWRQARAALRYDAASKKLILPFKHAGRTEIATTLALHMHRAGSALLARADILVPVPLHRWRLLRRRYNQAALLARALSVRTGLPTLPDALRRVRATAALGPLSAGARARAMQGAIEIRPNRRAAVAGRRVLLLDDVMTSGATAAACARALLDAGARSIDVLVASRVADPRTERPISGPGECFDEDD